MLNSGNLEIRIPSSTSGTKRKSESLQKHNAPSIQRMYAGSKENLCPCNKEKRTRKKRKKAEAAANGTVDNANPVELSANTFKGFVKMDDIHFLNAFLNHLLPLQVQLDQHVVSAEVQVHDEGKANSPLSEVVASERVDTTMISQSNIGEEPSLHSDPLQNELQKIQKETEELQKNYQDAMSGLKSECEKQMKELVAAVRKKYKLKFKDAQAQFRLKKNEANQNDTKIMHKLLADAYGSNSMNMWPNLPLMQQGFPSNFMQYHQHLVRSTPPNLQQISVPHPSFRNSNTHPQNPDVRPNYVPSSNVLQPQNIPTSNSQQNPSFQNFNTHTQNPNHNPSSNIIQPHNIPTSNFQQNPSLHNINTHPQNPNICPNYVPSSNMPQLHNIPANQMSSLVGNQFPSKPIYAYGYYPQGNHQFPSMPTHPCGYYYPQGHHQFPLVPSYPHGYLPQGYPFPPYCSLQGLKNSNLAVDPNSDEGKKTRNYQAETSTSSPNSESSADNNDD